MKKPQEAAELRKLLERRKKILLAKDDLIHFAEYMMPIPDKPDDMRASLYRPSKHHRVLGAALEKVEEGAYLRLQVTMPPRHGKTKLASHLFAAWYIGRHPENSMIVATYSEKFAWDHGRAVRTIIRSSLYKQVFPHIKLKPGSQSVDRLEIVGGGILFFLGRGSGITGRGADVILLDDPLKDRREADSPTIREQLWAWYTQVLQTRLMTKNGAIVIIQTRWHEDDLIGRLTDPLNPSYVEAEAEKWRVIEMPALALKGDVLGRMVNEPLWPERFDRDYLSTIRQTDVRGFQALYQGRPTPEEGAFFQSKHFRPYKHLKSMPDKERMRFYCASDHAVSLKQGRDKTCLMTVGVDEHDQIWIMPDLFWRQEPGVELSDGNPAHVRKAFDLYYDFDYGLAVRDMEDTWHYVAGLKECNGKVGAVGYCLGGKLCYLMCCRTDIDCAVAYYGTYIEHHIREAKNLHRPFLLHMAMKDRWVQAEVNDLLERRLSPNPLVQIHKYPNADHAFARHDGKTYSKPEADRALQLTLEFFRQHLHTAEMARA